MLRVIKKIVPKWMLKIYHYKMALLGAIFYGFPSRKIKVVGVTGTKGKSTTVEIVNAILEEAGFRTALSSTVHFKIAGKERRNLYKMTMPGRFFIQKFLHDAVKAKCDWVVIEMTSEGVKQFRHKFIDLDALIVTNISPEHIESHGSFEKYLEAKLEIAKALNNSKKKRKILITNKGDESSPKFVMIAKNCESIPFNKEEVKPFEITDKGIVFTYQGRKILSSLIGEFNLENILAAWTFAVAVGLPIEKIVIAITKFSGVRGRVEFVKTNNKQEFDVVVDYAHTIDSLTKLYEAFANQRKICVLGNTGGGRDKWKRQGMAEVADKYCDQIILTNEDPYDEDPMEILNQMRKGVKNKPFEIIMDRREAIREALRSASLAQGGNQKVIVLISGKGTDPYIMGPHGNKQEWDDASVVREELVKLNARTS